MFSSQITHLEEIGQDGDGNQEEGRSGGSAGSSSGGLEEGSELGNVGERSGKIGSGGLRGEDDIRDGGGDGSRGGERSSSFRGGGSGAGGVASSVELGRASIVEGPGIDLVGAAGVAVEVDRVVGGSRLANILDLGVGDNHVTKAKRDGADVVDGDTTDGVRPGDGPSVQRGGGVFRASRTNELNVRLTLERVIARELLAASVLDSRGERSGSRLSISRLTSNGDDGSSGLSKERSTFDGDTLGEGLGASGDGVGLSSERLFDASRGSSGGPRGASSVKGSGETSSVALGSGEQVVGRVAGHVANAAVGRGDVGVEHVIVG